MNNTHPAGKTVIVTGAADGIGRAIATEFAENGAKVIMLDIQDEKGEKLQKELGPGTGYYHCDLSSCSEIDEAYKKATEEFGCPDILVNNAGIPVRKPLKDITEEFWDKIHAVNTRAVYYMSRLAAEDMKKKGWGRIINMTSVRTEFFDDRHSGYSITKTGTEAVTRCFASEYGVFG
ncbi:MAG: SDR family oxidoreductase, partial [Lachnospiraceae bacterium]|nr:SDR family oxidoreductase [Lachnospiraceae bacterium]